MKRITLFLLSICFFFGPVAICLRSAAFDTTAGTSVGFAQPETGESGILALHQSLLDLANPFTVICIAAHPEDVDAGTLAYCRRKLGARTAILLATHGEGRDSKTRPEIDADLGVLRTGEMVSFARMLGADLYYLNLPDFGYSKSAEEALAFWHHDEALSRMVRAIRLLHPDVILTPHAAKSGEGQHQAVARLAVEAFAASASKSVGSGPNTEPWQTRRLFQEIPDAAAADAGTDVLVDRSIYEPARGYTCAQIGLSALRRLESLGPWPNSPTPSMNGTVYRLIRSLGDEKPHFRATLLDGLELPENLRRSVTPPRLGELPLVAGITQRDQLVDALKDKLIEKQAEGSIETLHTRYGVDGFRVVQFVRELERALALALGLTFEISVADPVVVPGQKQILRLQVRNGGAQDLPLVLQIPEGPPGSSPAAFKPSEQTVLAPGKTEIREIEYVIPGDARPTVPHTAHLFDEEFFATGTPIQSQYSQVAFGNRLLAAAEIGLGSTTFLIPAAVRFDVVPAVEISAIPFGLVQDWTTPREIEFPIRLRNRTPGELSGALWVVPLALSEDDYEPAHVSFAREDEELTVRMKLRLPLSRPPLSPDILIEFRREKPAPPAPLGTARIAVKLAPFAVADGLVTGYVNDSSDWLRFGFTQLGVTHSSLTVDDISVIDHGNGNRSANQSSRGCGDLGRFDTIVICDRAYLANPNLFSANRCLLRYVRQGGNLVVLSQQPDDWNAVLSRSPWAPFPLALSHERITVETTPVKLLEPDHLLLTKPNRIVAKDFSDWTADRAEFVPLSWSSEYIALFEMADPGEEPLRGTLLTARYGEGSFCYVTLDLRRQLLAGTPGAYRLFANLISYPKTLRAKPGQ